MPKLLGEFLLEKQEPFALDSYLSERGYSRRTILRRNRGRILEGSPGCMDFAKAVFGRLILHNNDHDKNKYSEVYTCINSIPDARSKKQLFSHVSLLQETESHVDEGSSPFHDKNYSSDKTTRGESSSTSISQNKPTRLFNTVRAFQEHDMSSSHDQYTINKKALRQTRQLLIDCVREVIEKHRKWDDDGGSAGFKKISGTEELWKVVCESVWLWSQNSIHETNILLMLSHDLTTTRAQEWTERQKEEISMDIGDAILEGIIVETFD